MIDLKSVIDFISIKYLKKVSSILREDGSNKRWIVMFEGETKTKFIQLDNKDLEIINQFRILKYK